MNRSYANYPGASTLPPLQGLVLTNKDIQTDMARIKRLLLEALEISFFLCNLNYTQYGLLKLWNLVNQILPTAYILNTSYWVYYSSSIGNCVCICNRFGIRCPHIRNNMHWLNMGLIDDSEDKFFFTSSNGTFPHPIDIFAFVDPIINEIIQAYDIKVQLKMGKATYQNNSFVSAVGPIGTVLIETRYFLTPHYYPLSMSLVCFQPNPSTHPHYSKYFSVLKRFLGADPFLDQMLTPRSFTMVQIEKPHFTLVKSSAVPLTFVSATPPRDCWGPGPMYTFHANFHQNQPTSHQAFHGQILLPAYISGPCKRAIGMPLKTDQKSSAYKTKRRITENNSIDGNPSTSASSSRLVLPPIASTINRLESVLNVNTPSGSSTLTLNQQSFNLGFYSDNYNISFPPLPQTTQSYNPNSIMENRISSTAVDNKNKNLSQPIPVAIPNVPDVSQLPPVIKEFLELDPDYKESELMPQEFRDFCEFNRKDYLNLIYNAIDSDYVQEISNEKINVNTSSETIHPSSRMVTLDAEDDDFVIDESE